MGPFRVLVTGGAGYIGSHFVAALCDAGAMVVVLDDLSSGHADEVDARATFVRGDIADVPLVKEVLRVHAIEEVAHFAAKIRVDESMTNPSLYYEGNVVGTLRLLAACAELRIPRFVFSSTAAVYGAPRTALLSESHELLPINPYGQTKLVIERALADYGAAYGMQALAFRYFNAAGADPQRGLRERHDPETHLIPIALEVAAGKRAAFSIFGTDYETTDGTCIRDFIHVQDLAEAHVLGLGWLRGGTRAPLTAMNLGTGEGISVRDVLEAARRVTGRPIPAEEKPRRAGDPPVLVASSDLAMRELSWKPTRSSIERILDDAWRAEAR